MMESCLCRMAPITIRVRYDLASIMSFSVTVYKGKCNNSYIHAYEPGISTTIENIPMKCQN